MDAAKRIAQWRELSPDQWLTLANRLLPPLTTAVLVLAVAYALAGLTWELVPGPRADAPAPEIAPAQGSSADHGGTANYGDLVDSHLFGEAKVQTQPTAAAPVDAPETTLDLELTGVQATTDSRQGQAIIASSRNHEKAYSVGDAIEGTNGVRLHAVYTDRVILDSNGQLETLHLPKAKAGQAAAAQTRLPGPTAGADQPSVRRIISNNATKISKVLRLVPDLQGGRMRGFRISPGPDRKAFDALGLKPGDVVTDVNGTPVNDPSKGLQVYQALGETTVANVTVLRNGSQQVIAIDTSQLQNVAKGLQ